MSDDWADDDTTTPDAPLEVDDVDEPETLYYASLPDFINDFFIPMFRRDVTTTPGQTWCPKWWLHPEAAYRLEGLWRSWEKLRLDPGTGASDWLRVHADHHLPIILDDRLSFRGCSIAKGHEGKGIGLTAETPPDGLYAAENS